MDCQCKTYGNVACTLRCSSSAQKTKDRVNNLVWVVQCKESPNRAKETLVTVF